MNSVRAIVLLAALCALAACASDPHAPPPPALHVSGRTGFAVTGRDGWQFDRVLRFGDFSTSPFTLGLARRTETACPSVSDCGRVHVDGIYDRQFDETFTASKSKFSFTQRGPDGQQAQVRAVDEMQRHHTAWMTRWFGFPTAVGDESDMTTSLTGTIEPTGADRAPWRFAIVQGEAEDELARPVGWAADDAGHRLVLKHLPLPAGVPRIVAQMSHGIGPGYAFELDGQVVGSVEMMTEGVVWMKDDLAPEVRLTLASLSSAMLLRPRNAQ